VVSAHALILDAESLELLVGELLAHEGDRTREPPGRTNGWSRKRPGRAGTTGAASI
jgi:hypothetical protein